MTAIARPWRGDPSELVVEFDPAVAARAFLDHVASLVPDWHRDALCREYPSQWWFPTHGEPTSRARAVCARCRVADLCLEEALADPTLDHGVRAGLAPRRRAAMRRERASEEWRP